MTAPGLPSTSASIVYNELNYPDLTALFAHLGVETVESDMSFAVTADAGRFEWKGGGINWRKTRRRPVRAAAQPVVAVLSVDASRYLTFNQQSVEDFAAGRLAGLTLGEYFKIRHFARGC